MGRKNEPTLEDAVLMDTVGSTLAEHRARCQFLIINVATACEMNPASVSNIEHGRQWPPLPTLRKMLNLYGVGLSKFFEQVERRL